MKEYRKQNIPSSCKSKLTPVRVEHCKRTMKEYREQNIPSSCKSKLAAVQPLQVQFLGSACFKLHNSAIIIHNFSAFPFLPAPSSEYIKPANMIAAPVMESALRCSRKKKKAKIAENTGSIVKMIAAFVGVVSR
jgi:hypothetical protein